MKNPPAHAPASPQNVHQMMQQKNPPLDKRAGMCIIKKEASRDMRLAQEIMFIGKPSLFPSGGFFVLDNAAKPCIIEEEPAVTARSAQMTARNSPSVHFELTKPSLVRVAVFVPHPELFFAFRFAPHAYIEYASTPVERKCPDPHDPATPFRRCDRPPFYSWHLPPPVGGGPSMVRVGDIVADVMAYVKIRLFSRLT